MKQNIIAYKNKHIKIIIILYIQILLKNSIILIIQQSDHFTFKKDRWKSQFDYIPFHKTIQDEVNHKANKIHYWFKDNIVINKIEDIPCYYHNPSTQFSLKENLIIMI